MIESLNVVRRVLEGGWTLQRRQPDSASGIAYQIAATHPCSLSKELVIIAAMPRVFGVAVHAVLVFYASLCVAVSAEEEADVSGNNLRRKGWGKGDLVPISCLNRTM